MKNKRGVGQPGRKVPFRNEGGRESSKTTLQSSRNGTSKGEDKKAVKSLAQSFSTDGKTLKKSIEQAGGDHEEGLRVDEKTGDTPKQVRNK